MRVNVTVSKSSLSMFDECERKWLLHYQRFRMPPSLKREILYQYRLMGLNALVGQIVDDVVTYSLRLYERKLEWPKHPASGAKKLLEQYIEETARWVYQYESRVAEPVAGRRQPIDRYFFESLPSDDEREALLERAEVLVRTWFDSGIPEKLVEYGVESWKTPPAGEPLPPSFESDGVVVWAKYDFAIHRPSETILFDWKTGKVTKDSENDVQDQLHTYAAYAIDQWQASPNHLRLFAVWLSSGAESCIHEYPFEPDRLIELKKVWTEKHATISSRLKQAGPNPDHLFDAFPMTNNLGSCKYCRFRSCEGYARLTEITDAYDATGNGSMSSEP